MANNKCGGWKLTGNPAFNDIVLHLSEAESKISLGDDVLLDEDEKYSLLWNLHKMRNTLNRISKYVKPRG